MGPKVDGEMRGTLNDHLGRQKQFPAPFEESEIEFLRPEVHNKASTLVHLVDRCLIGVHSQQWGRGGAMLGR